MIHVPGRSALAGDFRGRTGLREVYSKVFEELGGTIEVVEVDDVLVKDHRAVALVKERAVRGDAAANFYRVVVYHLDGGLIKEIWCHDYDLYALDDFWSDS